jgi:hypothetical protein
MRTWSTAAARRCSRALVILGAALFLVVLLAGPAMAGAYVDRAAAALKSDPVYVDPGARRTLSGASASALRDQIGQAGTPIYVAVLPAAALREARNSPDRLAEAIAAALDRKGTVGVIAGARTGASSDTLDPGVASAAMRSATAAHRGHLPAILSDFVDRVDQAAAAERPPWQSIWERPLVRPLVILVGATLVLVIGSRILSDWVRSRSAGRTSGFADVQALAHEDITALGEDLRSLESSLQAAGEDSPALRDHARAQESFQHGIEAYEQATSPNDFAAVSTALEAGRYYMTLARARFEEREVPQRRPPCFFDTRHGPSVDDVGWMPQTGPPRPVPACEACMRNTAAGVDPPVRQVFAGGRRMPFYDAPPHFESWFAGYFGGAAAGLVDGFPLGRALDDGYVGGLNTFGGGYGYLPVSYADTGVLDPGGGDIGQGRPGADAGLLIRRAGHDTEIGEE